MAQEVLFQTQAARRERKLAYCGTCGKTEEHLKEAGEKEFHCTACTERKKVEAAKQKGSGI